MSKRERRTSETQREMRIKKRKRTHLNLGNSNGSSDELLPEGGSESSDGELGSTVDGWKRFQRKERRKCELVEGKELARLFSSSTERTELTTSNVGLEPSNRTQGDDVSGLSSLEGLDDLLGEVNESNH